MAEETPPPTRRQWLGAALLGGGVAMAGAAALAGRGQSSDNQGARQNAKSASQSDLASPAISRNIRELRMVTTWPKGLPGLGQSADLLARNVEAMSEGRIRIRVFADGELVKALECFDAVSAGSADLYHGAEYYWTGKAKAFAFFTAVPFGMTAPEIMGWIDHGGGQALWEELSGQFNIIAMQAANTGHQMGGWFRREINRIDDWRGLKMRIPGLGGDVIRAMGASSVVIPGSDIFEALASGAIDATEWVGPWNDQALGFHRAAPYYYGPGFHEPGSSLAIGMNRNVWNQLSASDQAMIRAAAAATNHWSLGAFTFRNGNALSELLANGTQLRSFPDAVMVRAQEAARDIVAAVGQGDDLSRRIYQSFAKAQSSMRVWSQIGDGAYIRARALHG